MALGQLHNIGVRKVKAENKSYAITKISLRPIHQFRIFKCEIKEINCRKMYNDKRKCLDPNCKEKNIFLIFLD